jgi:hypothetical protein
MIDYFVKAKLMKVFFPLLQNFILHSLGYLFVIFDIETLKLFHQLQAAILKRYLPQT